MAKLIQKYQDDAGNEFDTEAEADAANAFIAAEFSIEAYITFADLKKAQAGLMRRHISGYIAFQNGENHDELVAAAAVRVKAEKAAAEAAKAAEKAAKKAAV